jgi:hypothetical protein
MKHCTLIATSIAASVLAGCASDTTKIQSAYVSPETYADYDCQQIGAEFSRLSRKAEELGAVVDKMASDDQAQAFVGIVLFWPALFFLEGSETQQTQEYARLKGQIDALETASVSKGCGTDIRQVAQYAQSAPSPTATAGRLESLKILYRDGAITEEEYVRRRKEISESAAREELRALEQEKAEQQAAASASQSSELRVRIPPRDESRLKVAVFPAITTRGTAGIANELKEFSWGMVNVEPSLTLVTLHPGIDGDAIWSGGFVDKRPVPDRVFDYMAELDADIGITYFYKKRMAGWYSDDLFTVDVYLFDGKHKRLHQRKGDERTYKDVARRMLREVAKDQGKTLEY